MYSIKSIILFFQYSINQTIFNRKLFQYFKNNPHATKQNLPPHLCNDLNYHDKWVLNKVGHDELNLFLADLLFDYPDEFLPFIISYVGTNPRNSLDTKQFIEDLRNKLAQINGS